MMREKKMIDIVVFGIFILVVGLTYLLVVGCERLMEVQK
jgi:hypothetical protein